MERTSPALSPELLLRQADFVRSLARGLLADPGAAEDVAQDAFVTALSQPPASSGALRVWLARVVRNLVAQRRRGEARRLEREERSARAESIPSVADVLQRESLRAEIVGAVLSLREPYRTAILLRFYEGRGPPAIAALLGVPVETVRTRTKTALALLRQRLDRGFGERSTWAGLLLPLARGPLPTPLGRIAESLPPVLAVAVMSTQAKVAGAAAGAGLIAVLFFCVRGSPLLSRAEEPGQVSPPAALQRPPTVPEDLVSATTFAERAPVLSQSSTPSVPDADEGSLRVRVSWFDGSPAEAIGVLVQPNWRSGVSPLRTREYSTDAAGEVRVEGLPPGDALVELDRDVNASEIVEIAPGAEVEVELSPARGFDVSGVVRDPGGAPVAGAEIWVTRDTEITRGFVLTRTDAEGRFALRSLEGGSIGARARGFAPSLCKGILAGEGAALEVDLVLMGPGGAVTGTVVDPAGRPLAQAWVAIGLDHPHGLVQMVPVGGSQRVKGLLPGEIETRTDAEGRYRIDGLAPGLRRMAVRAQGFAAWRGEVDVLEQRTRSQDVQVQPGVTLVGRLTKPDGTPARGTVEVEDDVEMLRTEAFTDAEGRFRLEGLEVGVLEVRATGRRRAGRAQATLRGGPGETLTWDVCLSMGGAIRGRVLDENGAPLARWQVLVNDDSFVSEDHDYAQAETDTEGRFVLQDMHDRPHRVEASPPEHFTFPVATARGIYPEREELVLRIESAQLPSVRFVGRVVDALGQPVDDAHIALGKKAGSGSLFYPEPSGAFDIGPIPPGTWALTVGSPALVDCPRLVLGSRELGPGEVWDCGTIVLARGGTVFVTAAGAGLVTAAGAGLGPDAEPDFRVLREGVFPAPLERRDEGWRSGPLQDGAYRLQVRGRGVAAAQLPFEIRSGETTRLAVQLQPGLRAEIRVEAPAAGERAQPMLRITRGDELVLEDQIWLREDAEGFVHPGDYGTEASLAPGSYRVEAWFEDGPRASGELTVVAGEPASLQLELH